MYIYRERYICTQRNGSMVHVSDSPPQISAGNMTNMIVINIATQDFTHICIWMQE